MNSLEEFFDKNQEDYLVELIDSLPFKVVYVEVGVLRGECIVPIAKNSKNIEKCIGIDPYESYIDTIHGNYTVGKLANKLNLEVCKKSIIDNNVQDKVELILEDSHVAKNRFEDESVGVVYLDKGFTYEEQCQDIKEWYPKIRPGGYLTGHEWGSPIVNKAIVDTCKELGIYDNLVGEDNVWKLKKE